MNRAGGLGGRATAGEGAAGRSRQGALAAIAMLAPARPGADALSVISPEAAEAFTNATQRPSKARRWAA